MPPTSQALSSRGNEDKGATRRSRRAAEQNDTIIEEDEDEDEDEEDEEESGSDQGSDEESEESADEEVASPTARPTMHSRPPSYSSNNNNNNKRRPPPKPLNVNNGNSRRSSRANSYFGNTANNNYGGGSSQPSYEDSTSYPSHSGDNYAYLPTPPSGRQFPNSSQHPRPFSPSNWNSPLSPPLAPPSYRTIPTTTARPRRPRTNTLPPAWERQPSSSSQQSSAEDSSSSASGPWRSMPPSSLAANPGRAPSRPVPPKRSKTVREPAGAPVQAVVPRAPRTVAAARTRQLNDMDEYNEAYYDDENDEDYDDDGVEEIPGIPTYRDPNDGRPPMQEIQRTRKLPAGGKKAKLAVELKMNLEVEIELKAYIHGDVTLELFN